MTWHPSSTALCGYSNFGSIVITFAFPEGKDEDGIGFAGRSETAYLPDNPEGRQTLNLFAVAFKRRIMFGIGNSMSGGRRPTFNIHLKTKMVGGQAAHGYPDPGYINRTLSELALNGVKPERMVNVNTSSEDQDKEGIHKCTVCGEPIMGVVICHGGKDYHFGCIDEDCRREFVPRVSSAAPSSSQESRKSQELESIPCDVCGCLIPFEDYAEHTATHSSSPAGVPNPESRWRWQKNLEHDTNFIPCEDCGRLVPCREFSAHQQMHDDLKTALQRESLSREPDGIALLTVEMVREAGTLLPDSSDTAREVCNFDVVVPFVYKMHYMYRQHGAAAAQPEIVYHWTREEHIHSIVENNLKAPGETNLDGSHVNTAHGSVYGKGIYAATNMSFGEKYGHGASSVLLCLGLPGTVQKGSKLTAGSDSLQNGVLRVYSESSQLLPLFLTNSENEQLVREIADQVVTFLVGQVRP